MERNFTETLGAGATVQLEPRSRDRFSTSIPARNMHRLEELAYTIAAPVWPEHVLGEIDRTLTAAGEAIYNQRCAVCHEYTVADYKANGILPLRRFCNARSAWILPPLHVSPAPCQMSAIWMW
jgi:hypothetical protein